MKKHGFASGSEPSRRGCAGSRVWALDAAVLTLCVSWLSACSGSTDVVGVLPQDVETGALEGASESSEGIQGVSEVTGAEGTSSEFSIVAGMPISDWEDRPALDWPFNVSLREFFADGSRPGQFGPPPSVERQVIAVMGRQAKLEHVRVVAAGPEISERLRDVFAEADVELDGEMVARVMRDRRSDEYRVALGLPSCGGYSASHHGGPCAEAAADGVDHP